jgi:phenylalanyl-tRNA synthetase beta chain
MPVIEVNLRDFQQLLGKKVALTELRDRLPMMGTGWEGLTEDGFYLEVFPNRPDLLSIEGLVRAYASWTGVRTGLKKYNVNKSEFMVYVDERTKVVRPYFLTAVVKNVDFDDAFIRSLIQMQEKLHMTHGRKRRKVAIGLHSMEQVEFPIIYTTKPSDFSFRPLGERFGKKLSGILSEMPKGREYAWIVDGFKEYPIIMDKKEMVLSMPPIINSEHTRVDEMTKELFIDVTGTDIKAITEVLNVICTTFIDWGAEIYEVHNYYPDGTVLVTPNLNPWEMELDVKYINKTLGSSFTDKDAVVYLEKMGYGAEIHREKINVKIPCYRADIMHPIDLVEDIAIAYGYENFEPEIPIIYSEAGEALIEIFSRKLRNFLVGFGLLEVVTFMMSNEEKLFNRMNLPKEAICETENPKMEAYNSLRNRLLPSLMEVLSYNKHHQYPQNLFEVDDVVILDPDSDTGAKTKRRLAIVICHAKANFSEIKAVTNSILDNLLIKFDIEEGGWECFLKGRRFIAKIGSQKLCWAGEIHPQVLSNWGIEMPVAALEMDIDLLLDLIKRY